VLIDAVLPLLPVASEIEAVGGEDRGNEFENGQRNAPGVDQVLRTTFLSDFRDLSQYSQ